MMLTFMWIALKNYREMSQRIISKNGALLVSLIGTEDMG